jgi:hypothetical protein
VRASLCGTLRLCEKRSLEFVNSVSRKNAKSRKGAKEEKEMKTSGRVACESAGHESPKSLDPVEGIVRWREL